jgi:hypothetical protein
MRADAQEGGGLCHRNNHRTRRIWAPLSDPPRRLRPRGMRSPMSMPLSTRCWRGHGGHPAAPLRAAVDRSGVAQGDPGDLVRGILRHAVAGDRPAVRHSVRHAVHAVRPLDPARAVAPPAQPLDPGLAAGLRRQTRTQRRHHRQPVVSFRAELLRARFRRRQEDQGHQDPSRGR